MRNLIPCPLTGPAVGAAIRNIYLDVVGICEEHREAIDSHAPASCRRKAILQCGAEIFINEHGFVIACGFCLSEKNGKRRVVQRQTVPLLPTPAKKGNIGMCSSHVTDETKAARVTDEGTSARGELQRSLVQVLPGASLRPPASDL